MHIHDKLIAAATLFALSCLAGLPAEAAAPGDGAAGEPPVSSSSPDSAEKPAGETSREEILDWLDQYLTEEVLFRKEDIEALRAKVAQMSPDQLQQWLDQTQEIRDTLASDQWQSTQVWLEGYLPTKLYNDREMEQFRQDVGAMSPGDLLELLRRIQQKHDTVQSIYDAQYSAAVRAKQAEATVQMQSQSRLGWLQSYQKNQAAARQSAAQRNPIRSTRPLYGQTQAHAASRRTEASRRYNQPLVTSRDAAAIAVDRAIYGGYRRGW